MVTVVCHVSKIIVFALQKKGRSWYILLFGMPIIMVNAESIAINVLLITAF